MLGLAVDRVVEGYDAAISRRGSSRRRRRDEEVVVATPSVFALCTMHEQGLGRMRTSSRRRLQGGRHDRELRQVGQVEVESVVLAHLGTRGCRLPSRREGPLAGSARSRRAILCVLGQKLLIVHPRRRGIGRKLASGRRPTPSPACRPQPAASASRVLGPVDLAPTGGRLRRRSRSSSGPGREGIAVAPSPCRRRPPIES